MVSTAQLSAVMKGVLMEHIAEHGYESLLPGRKEPLDAEHLRALLAIPTGSWLGRTMLDWSSPLFLSLGGLFAVAASTGIRKAEGATPSGRELDQRRLRRANLLWHINGSTVADPSPVQLSGLVEGRDSAILVPPHRRQTNSVTYGGFTQSTFRSTHRTRPTRRPGCGVSSFRSQCMEPYAPRPPCSSPTASLTPFGTPRWIRT
jgi:hypothetical protein